MLSEKQKHIIIKSLRPFQPTLIGLFGSYARNKKTEESDMDILYDFEKKHTLFGLIALKEKLKSELNKTVDLVSLQFLSPTLKSILLMI